MTYRRLLLPTLALSLALSHFNPSRAQTNYNGSVHWYALPGIAPASSPGPYGAGVALRFSEDAQLDYVALDLDSGLAILWQNFMVHGAPVPLGIPGTDITVLPDFQQGGPQAIVMTSSGWLTCYWYESDELRFSVIGDAYWRNAKTVDSGHFTDETRWDLVGLAGDSSTVLFLEQDAAGNFASRAGFSVPPDVLQVEVLDIDSEDFGDGIDEIAFRYADGFKIYDANGGLRTDESVTPETTVAMSPFRDESAGLQHIALITENNNGGSQQWLRLYDGSGVLLLTHALPPSFRVATCTSVDFDPSADVDELVLSATSQVYPLMLSFPDISTQPLYEDLFVPDIGMDAVAPNNQAVIVAGDFDYDGDQDLVYAAVDLEDLYVFKNYHTGEDLESPAFSGGVDNDDGTIVLTWDMPVNLDPSATIVQLSIWNKRGPQGQLPTLPIETPETFWEDEWVIGTQAQIKAVIILGPDASDWDLGELILYCRMRVARTDSAGNVIMAGPASVQVVAGRIESLTALFNASPWELETEPALFDESDFLGAGAYPSITIHPHLPGDPPGGAGGT